MQETQVWSLGGKIPRRRKWQLTVVFLPEKSHGQRNLVGYSPWGLKRVSHDWVTEHTHMKMIIIVYSYSRGLKCIFSTEWVTGKPGLLYTPRPCHISHPATGSSLPWNFPSFSLKDLHYFIFFSLPLVAALYSSLSPFSHCLPLSLTKGW